MNKVGFVLQDRQVKYVMDRFKVVRRQTDSPTVCRKVNIQRKIDKCFCLTFAVCVKGCNGLRFDWTKFIP